MAKITKVEALKDRGGNLPGVYAIHHLPSNQWYVGQTKGKIIDRIYQHINNIYAPDESQQEISRRSHIDSVFQLKDTKDHINDDFDFLVKFSIPDLQDYTAEALKSALNHQEANYIREYDSEANGFNQTVGNHSETLAREAAYKVRHIVTMNIFELLLSRV